MVSPLSRAGRGGRRGDGHIRFHDDGFVIDDRWVSAAEVELCDVDSLDPLGARRLMAAFTTLCRSASTPWQLTVRIRPDDGPGFRRDLHLLFSGATASDIGRTAEMVASVMQGAGVGYRPLEGEELRARLEGSGLWSRHHETWRLLQTDKGLYQSLRVAQFPVHAVAATWLRPLLTVDCAADVAIHFDPIPKSEALTSLGRRLRDLYAERLYEAERGTVPSVELSTGTDSAMVLRNRLATASFVACRLLMCASALGADPAGVNANRAILEDALRGMGCSFTRLWGRQRSGALSVLPLCRGYLRYSHLLDATSCSAFMPWTVGGTFPDDGYEIGHDRSSRRRVRISPFDQQRNRNANVGIYAASGHGKSYTVGTLLLQAHRRGLPAIVIDPENEYEGVTHAIGGAYVPLEPGSGCTMNPLQIGNSAEEVIATAAAFLNVAMGGKLDEVERAGVAAAAREALAKAGSEGRHALLADLIDPLTDIAPRVVPLVQRLISGPLTQLFGGPQTALPATGSQTFGLRGLDRELLPAATLLLARHIWCLIRDDPRPRHIVFDEVGLLANCAPMRELLVQLARRCRKYQASLVVATQNVGDLLRSEDGTVVVTNSSFVLLGGHRATETSLMQRAFDLTDAQTASVAHAGRGQFLLIEEQRRHLIDVAAAPEHHAILTGSQ